MPLSINEFRYDLPEHRIALYPLAERDQSKLLVFEKGNISHKHFYEVATVLPGKSLLIFNDTKVIPARMLFTKNTGAAIEIFLLAPVSPSTDLAVAMAVTGTTTWKCTIGNAKRWTPGTVLTKEIDGNTLQASLVDKENGLVQFVWTGNSSFAEIVRKSGVIPLPPYLKRNAEKSDTERYQTIYSNHEGAVAAPTAGLHFTERVFQSLDQKNIRRDFVTLHVSAGTFQPVKTDNPDEHIMHHEQMVVYRRNVENILQDDQKIIAVGTTSMRTLESLYWFGAKLMQQPGHPFSIGQNDPYAFTGTKPTRRESFLKIKEWMDEHHTDVLMGDTSIFIKPGYNFMVCDGLITNFHQPGSTLMLLVAAFVGERWKEIYQQALDNDYRFLSYGDSSVLLP